MAFSQVKYAVALAALFATNTLPAKAAETASYSLTLANHLFEPATLQVPAGVKFQLSIKNASTEVMEFESAELNREKIVPPGATATVFIGPLQPGVYPFVDDFHQETKGQLVAK